MQTFNPVKNQSVVNRIERLIVGIRVVPMATDLIRQKEAALLVIKTQRMLSGGSAHFFDKRLCSVLTDILKHLVPCMSVKTYEEINELLKTKKE